MRPLDILAAPFARRARAAAAPIGLDLALDKINLVQFDGDVTSPAVRAATSLAYPVPRDELLADRGRLKALVQQAMNGRGFRGRRVVSCLRHDELRILMLNYAVAPGADDAAAIAAELRERLKGELATSVVDYIPIRHGSGDPGRREALVVVATRDTVMRHLALLDSVGLEAVSLDVGPAALARLVSFVNVADPSQTHPNVLLVNFGAARSHLSVVWGRRLILDRAIEVGETQLLERLTKMLGVTHEIALRMLEDRGFGESDGEQSDDDAELARTLAEVLRPDFNSLVGEINKTLVYTASQSRGRGIDRIYLLGSVGRWRGIGPELQRQIEIPVEVLNPFRAFRSTVAEAEIDRLRPIAGIALACGLSLKGLQGDA